MFRGPPPDGQRPSGYQNPYAPPQAEILEPETSSAQSWIVQSVAVGLVLAAVLWSPLSFEPLHNRLAWHGVQVLFAVGLAVLLPRGVLWARWTVVVGCAAIGIEQLYTSSVFDRILEDAALATSSLSSVYWLVLGISALHFLLAALLVLPRSVRDFYASPEREE